MTIDHAIELLRREFFQQLKEATTSEALENLRVKYLGKKGPLQELMKLLKDASAEERRFIGKAINDLKEEITTALSAATEAIGHVELNMQIEREKLDVTLPGRRRYSGRKHPVTEALGEILNILMGMGFSVQYGPDIDTDYYNFEALNFKEDHPARDMQDTFYIDETLLLRTHTSTIQARIMEQQKPPIRIIAPGKAYRNETITARSHVFFHQVDAFYIDKGVSFGDLISTLEELYSKLFGKQVQMRFRPSYFPFVEPGMEVDINCLSCQGSGCPLCKYTGWLEVCGAGMIHPEVLRNGGIDPETYTGYAWGMGVERTLLLKRGVKDIRQFTENDLRFLQQFTSV